MLPPVMTGWEIQCFFGRQDKFPHLWKVERAFWSPEWPETQFSFTLFFTRCKRGWSGWARSTFVLREVFLCQVCKSSLWQVPFPRKHPFGNKDDLDFAIAVLTKVFWQRNSNHLILHFRRYLQVHTLKITDFTLRERLVESLSHWTDPNARRGEANNLKRFFLRMNHQGWCRHPP